MEKERDLMKTHRFHSKNFNSAVRKAVERSNLFSQSEIRNSVLDIIKDVKKNGDRSLIRYTKKFDGVRITPSSMRVAAREIEAAYKSIDKKTIGTLKAAARRIRQFHHHQKEKTWSYREKDGTLLGQIIQPLDTAGLYIPGGKAVYPSTVLMNAIPAQIAGVRRIVAVSPARERKLSPYILVAAHIAGINEIYKIGGAQAIAALAFGTATIPKVDKIVGPGNVYVAEAKRAVFGEVAIDSIAGPSEILILADETGNPEFLAADLLSQAEHDEMAVPILVTDSETLAESVKKEVKRQVKELKRHLIAEKCLKDNGKIFIVKDWAMAVDLSNRFAPEHLEIVVKNPKQVLAKIKHAGAVFLGHHTPEALGDYAAGPNHVLPTGGTARFFSPLGVYDFFKRTSLISFSEKGLRHLAKTVVDFTELEGLEAHGKAVEARLKPCK